MDVNEWYLLIAIFCFPDQFGNLPYRTMGCFDQSTQETTHLLNGKGNSNKTCDTVQETTLNNNMDDKDIASSTPDNTTDSKTKLVVGYGLGLVGVAIITTGLACAQALDKSIPHSQLNGFRFGFQLAIVCPFVIGYNNCDIKVEKNRIGWVVLCAILFTLMSYGIYGAAYYLPLGVTSGIIFSLILIINFCIGIVINSSVRWYDLTSVIACVTGVIMVTQPEFIFNHVISPVTEKDAYSTCHVAGVRITANGSTENWMSYTIQTDKQSLAYNEQIIGYILCASAGVLGAANIHIINKKLTDVNIFTCNLWISVFGMTSSFGIMAATEDPYFPTIPQCITWLLLHSLTSGSYVIVSYKFVQLLDPVAVSLILTLQIPALFVLQFTLFTDLHPGHTDSIGIGGSVLVIIGNMFVPLYQLMGALCKTKQKN